MADLKATTGSSYTPKPETRSFGLVQQDANQIQGRRLRPIYSCQDWHHVTGCPFTWADAQDAAGLIGVGPDIVAGQRDVLPADRGNFANSVPSFGEVIQPTGAWLVLASGDGHLDQGRLGRRP